MQSKSVEHKGYMPQLDTLRAFAVLLVIISHWMPAENILNRYLYNGISGVTLFFVLSGFLITGILLKSKEKIDAGGSMKQALKTFYIRRSLRIFPLYYLVICIAWIFNESGIRENFGWHFFYLSNFYFWKHWHWQQHLSHLWSLSVEEQFYLFWPAIVFLIPRKKLPAIFIGAVAIAIAYRLKARSPWGDFARFLTPGSLDSFGIGALLAYGKMYMPRWFTIMYKPRNIVIIVLLVLYLAARPLLVSYGTGNFHRYSFWFYGVYFPFISLFFGYLIAKAAEGIDNKFLAPVFNNRVLIYLGKISYGLYLLHNFVPMFYNIPFPQFLQPYSFFLANLLRLIFLIAVCSASWYFFEKPILRLKSYFEYNKKEKKELLPSTQPATITTKSNKI